MDGKKNARLFLQLVQPALIIFIKYEFGIIICCRQKKEISRFCLFLLPLEKASLF